MWNQAKPIYDLFKGLYCDFKNIYGALQQTREQYTQAYFEKWTIEVGIKVKNNLSVDLKGHNWVQFAHRPKCTVTLNSNFAILKTWNYFQLE